VVDTRLQRLGKSESQCRNVGNPNEHPAPGREAATTAKAKANLPRTTATLKPGRVEIIPQR